MQRTIIRQFKQENESPTEQMTAASLFFEWRHHMTESINLITARMNRPLYRNNWIFSAPRQIPRTVDYHNWHTTLQLILHTTLHDHYYSNIHHQFSSELQFALSSNMDSEFDTQH